MSMPPLAGNTGRDNFPGMPRKYERGASALVQIGRHHVSADDAAARFAERDARQASDTRTEAQRWLNEPEPVRSALVTRKPSR